MNVELIPWSEDVLDEVARIFTHCDRSYLSGGLPLPYTRENAQDWFQKTVEPREGRDGMFRILCVDGKCAGIVTLQRKEDVFHRDADIGYLLLDAYGGRGAMTEAVGRICKEGFGKLNLLRISARVFAPNEASRRVLEKNGFALEGVMPRAVCKGEDIYDLCLYGRLRDV